MVGDMVEGDGCGGDERKAHQLSDKLWFDSDKPLIDSIFFRIS